MLPFMKNVFKCQCLAGCVAKTSMCDFPSDYQISIFHTFQGDEKLH